MVYAENCFELAYKPHISCLCKGKSSQQGLFTQVHTGTDIADIQSTLQPNSLYSYRVNSAFLPRFDPY